MRTITGENFYLTGLLTSHRYMFGLVLALGILFAMPTAGIAQTGGAAGIQGTVTDQTGAVVPNATVIATNTETHIVTTRATTGEGLYTISPILPGTYTVRVKAPGFSEFVQENFVIDALKLTGLNVTLKPGTENVTVTVSEAPPALETTNATLGGVVENKLYTNLPIQMSGQQRDATAFATLLPGAQSGSRAPVIGGTTNYMAELYLDGLPETVATQQGDNRVIFNSVPIDSIEQFQVLTSSIPPEYQGAGLLNFTIKSGTDMYHGSANIFVRNTVFDTWNYLSKQTSGGVDANGNKLPPKKPYENQNEISGVAGGPIPLTHHKGFFEFTYDRYHGRAGVNPGLLTVPTVKMRTGDFSELLAKNGGPGYIIYDPLSQAACTANNGTVCRYAYGQSYTGAPATSESQVTNVIPAGQLSPIAQYMQKFLPTPTNSGIENNYLGGLPSGYDNWSFLGRVDYDMTPNQRLSLIWAKGSRLNVPYTFGANPTLPMPYARVSIARVIIDLANLEDTWTLSPTLVNQFKFGLLYFGGPPVTNATQGITQYEATTAGITNLPQGQASQEFPGATFSGSYVPTQWTNNGASGATYTSKSIGYTYGDNLLWTKGKHAFTFGFQYQFLEANASTYDGPSGVLTSTYNTTPTALPVSSTSTTSNTGYSYASYLLGGPSAMATTIQTYGVMGGRYHPFAPYVADDWKITPRLTLNLGFRWDYLPTYHEAHDRWSFLNPSLTNTITGNPGMVQFAGKGASGAYCNCGSPAHTWMKNFGPRLGLAYQVDDKTVVHAGFGLFYSHGGGVGGRAGAAAGAGQLGYSTSASISGAGVQPAFWLNNSTAYASSGLSNTDFGGPGYALPQPTGATTAGQLLNTGNYVDSTGTYQQSNGSVTYVDPYISGRAPTFAFFNFGVQRALRTSTTISVNYSGSESHFLATGSSSAVGYWANQLDPKYMVGLSTTKTSAGANILSAQATSANIAVAQAAMPGISVPYTGYAAAGNKSSKATIQQMLLHFPQYAGVSNLWGQNVGNNSYHSLQLSLIQRSWSGLNFQLNYTYSKNIGDDGTYRSGYDIPAAAIDAGGKSFNRGRVDRSWTTNSIPQALRVFGIYESPFGRNKIGSDNFWVRNLAGGWLLSGIFSYTSGTPLAITVASCSSTAGTCMPDLNPDYGKKTARIGKWAYDGASHVDSSAFLAPQYYGATQNCTKNCTQMIGGAPRTRAMGLSNPSSNNLDLGLKRQFQLTSERFKLVLEANCLDVTHRHGLGGIGVSLPAASYASTDTGKTGATRYFSSSSFGKVTTVSGNRDFQFAAHITF